LADGVEQVDAFLNEAEKALKKAREGGRNLTIKHSELAGV